MRSLRVSRDGGLPENAQLFRHQLKLRRVGTGTFQALHLLVELLRFGGGLSDRTHVRPGGVARDHPEMADHRDSLSRHGLDDPEA